MMLFWTNGSYKMQHMTGGRLKEEMVIVKLWGTGAAASAVRHNVQLI